MASGMSIVESLARPLIAGMFIYGGLDSLRRPAPKVPAAEGVVEGVSESTGMDTEQLVKINGAVQVVAGSALALGIFPRPAALALAASLVPTTLAGHRFWEAEGDAKPQQTIHFLKNLSMFGGLIVLANSVGGRPSLPWRARRAVHRSTESARDALQHLHP
jgi:putative oxidoreductase